MRGLRRLSMASLCLATIAVLVGCPSANPTGGSTPSASSTSAGRGKGAKDAADAIAAEKLMLKERLQEEARRLWQMQGPG